MTREEAINWLKAISFVSDNHITEAIDMAIEALHREEAEAKGYCHRIKPKELQSRPSIDLISRADAIKAVAEHFSFDDGCSNIYKDIDYYKGIAEHILKNVPSAEQVTSKLNNPCNSLLTDESNGSKEHKSKLDLISRQDVIEALSRSSVYAWSIEQDQTAHNWALNIIKALPSADAEPTVIRAKTFMRKEDFNKWADDIKKQNKSIVCIPCDAEVVSAEAEQGVWEHIESKWADNIFKCSKCGNPLIIPTVDGEPIYNYCVHCGAKMGNAWGERND